VRGYGDDIHGHVIRQLVWVAHVISFPSFSFPAGAA
jgi:hypothetical protein